MYYCAHLEGSNDVEWGVIGRAPMYDACAMGAKGGDQALLILKRQIQQVMEQVGCEKLQTFPNI